MFYHKYSRALYSSFMLVCYYNPSDSCAPACVEKGACVDAMSQIAKAAEGLLFSSESDYPLEPFTWTDPTPFSPDALYKLTKLPQSTPVAKESVNTFFAPMVHVPPGATPDDRQRVARFKSLLKVLRQDLSDLAVYKLGSVEMPAFVVGHLPDGSVAGLRTTVVET